MVSANPNATVVAIAERAAEQILSCVDNSLRRGRSDTRVSRRGSIPALIVLSPELLNEWTHPYKSTATMLGLTLPVPDSLIHMTLFLGALTFMYISARAAGDAEYRSTFLDPLIDDLRTTLIARNRYRGAVAVAACVDGTQVSD